MERSCEVFREVYAELGSFRMGGFMMVSEEYLRSLSGA